MPDGSLELRLDELRYHYQKVDKSGTCGSCIVCMAVMVFVEALRQFTVGHSTGKGAQAPPAQPQGGNR